MEVYSQISKIESLLEASKIDAAREQINRLAQEFPDLWYVPMFRARLALSLDDYKEAEQQAQQAIAINAENTISIYFLSVAQHKLRKYDEALKHIDMAISIDPNEPHYYAFKGQQLMHRERYGDAEFVVREGLKINPDHEGCLNVLALSQNLQGKRGVASNTVGELLEANPESADTHANAGYLALHTNQIEKARTHFVEALRLEPDNQWAQGGLAEVIKATNPFYRQFLRFSVWMSDIGSEYRWGLIIGLLIVIRLLPFLVPFYLILLVWTWFTSPISNAFLLIHPQGKYLIQKEDKGYISGVFVCFLLAVIVGVSAVVLGENSYFYTAAGLGFAAIPLNRIADSDKEGKSIYISLGWAAIFIGLGIWAGTGDSTASTAFIFSGVAYSWIGARLG